LNNEKNTTLKWTSLFHIQSYRICSRRFINCRRRLRKS